jgi:sugar lactone lactonase YvrE
MKYRVILFVLSFAILSQQAQAQLKQIITIAGNGETGYGIGGTGVADGVPSVSTSLSAPLGVTVDIFGNVYILDAFNMRIRKVSAGIITTYAGKGTEGYSGDGSIANSAQVIPSGIALDKHGNLYISDASYSVIRKVNTLGIISTIAGTGTFGHTGDGGPATAARIGKPHGIFVDTADNIFFADAGNSDIRRISQTGIISTVAGNGTPGYSGDGFSATAAQLDSPYSVAVDRVGNIFISDFFNDVIRKVDKETGEISTYAGQFQIYNYSGDNGMATDATLNNPRGIAIDSTGNLFIADAENNVIRMVDVTGKITTVVGNGTLGFGGDGSYALGCNLHNPYGVSVDQVGSIYVADANNQRVRKAYSTKVAVNNVAVNSGIQVYPNPATDAVVVTGLSNADKVSICDLAGRSVTGVWTVKNDGKQTFEINNIAPGIYMLQVSDATGSKKATLKVIKD